MKNFMLVCCLFPFSLAFADPVPYNLCADKTKSDCKALHMPNFGQIDSQAGNKVFSCDAYCRGDATVKSTGAVTLLMPAAADLDYSHYLTFEASPGNFVYIKPNPAQNNFERILASEENNNFTLQYCRFSSENIGATMEMFKKKHSGASAGPTIIDNQKYEDLKSAFQAQENKDACEQL